jgi:hypothetical protein
MTAPEYAIEVKYTKSGTIQFKILKPGVNKLNLWLDEVKKKAAKIQAETDFGKSQIAKGMKLPYYGPIETGIQFMFVETGIGVVCKVTEIITGETIDLTDYDSW